MKKFTLLFIIPILFVAFGCGKGHLNCCVAAQPLNTTALKNDSIWTASSFEGAGGYFGMKINAAGIPPINKNNIKDTLVMTVDYKDGQSVYKLNSGQVYYHAAVAGGPVKTYQLDSLYTGNQVIIDKYDMHANISTGTFTLKLLNPGQPDISFVNGKFQVLITY
jgi:hypothetical protein